MPSLLDVAPPELTAETVEIRGTPLTVSAIDNEGWARLHARFPELRSLLAGREAALSPIVAMKSQAALIAAGLGHPDDDETERLVMERLNAEDQKQIVETVVRLSMPGHVFGPLLNGAAGDPVVAQSTAVRDTKSPRLSRP